MGAKKKVQVPQPPPQAPQQKIIHATYTLRSSDGAEFKLGEEQMTKHSPKLRSLAEASKDEIVVLEEIQGKALQVVVDYINLHKEKDPVKIPLPLRSNQAIKYVMEEADAQLVEHIMAKGDQFLLRMFDVSLYLEMEGLRKRLACGVAIRMMRSTLEELKEEYQLDKQMLSEDELKSEMRQIIENLKLIPDEEQ